MRLFHQAVFRFYGLRKGEYCVKCCKSLNSGSVSKSPASLLPHLLAIYACRMSKHTKACLLQKIRKLSGVYLNHSGACTCVAQTRLRGTTWHTVGTDVALVSIQLNDAVKLLSSIQKRNRTKQRLDALPFSLWGCWGCVAHLDRLLLPANQNPGSYSRSK